MNLASIHVFPVKSFRGNDSMRAVVEARGLRDDRRWMLVDANARFVTARQLPRMLLFRAHAEPAGLSLVAPDGSTHTVARPAASEPLIQVAIWQSSSPARCADAETNAWISHHLGSMVRLVYMADDCVRSVSKAWAQPGDIVSFADGFPLLLIGTASLDGLNARLAQPVSMANFRPNLVVHTDTPHVEDRWRLIRIGDCTFSVSKPCTRCVLTTIDPERATPASDGEPLATLKTYRRESVGVTFGQNLLVRGTGELAPGMPVEVLE
jgi:uncharacterized protein YcbX